MGTCCIPTIVPGNENKTAIAYILEHLVESYT